MLPSHFKTICEETSGALMLRMLTEKRGHGEVGRILGKFGTLSKKDAVLSPSLAGSKAFNEGQFLISKCPQTSVLHADTKGHKVPAVKNSGLEHLYITKCTAFIS